DLNSVFIYDQVGSSHCEDLNRKDSEDAAASYLDVQMVAGG
ncbi:hypothetical protein Tco_1434649, partial [Tanacetum coccineum]